MGERKETEKLLERRIGVDQDYLESLLLSLPLSLPLLHQVMLMIVVAQHHRWKPLGVEVGEFLVSGQLGHMRLFCVYAFVYV